jgi:CRP-like cAMP-binding protein
MARNLNEIENDIKVQNSAIATAKEALKALTLELKSAQAADLKYPTKDELVNYLQANPGRKRSQIAKDLGCSPEWLTPTLTAFRASGLVRSEGEKINTVWFSISESDSNTDSDAEETVAA